MSAVGRWEDVFGAAGPEIARTAEAARALILRVHPESLPTARPGERTVTFGFGPRKMTEGYCYLMPHARWLNLGFFDGARLPDPQGLLQGSGKALRHVRLHDPAETGHPALAALVAAAVDLRGRALGRTP